MLFTVRPWTVVGFVVVVVVVVILNASFTVHSFSHGHPYVRQTVRGSASVTGTRTGSVVTVHT